MTNCIWHKFDNSRSEPLTVKHKRLIQTFFICLPSPAMPQSKWLTAFPSHVRCDKFQQLVYFLLALQSTSDAKVTIRMFRLRAVHSLLIMWWRANIALENVRRYGAGLWVGGQHILSCATEVKEMQITNRLLRDRRKTEQSILPAAPHLWFSLWTWQW